jgi:DNA-binding MarR family transcriptional regulator
MKVQGSVILNLYPEINKRNVSFAQLFLLTRLMTEEYMNMGDIAKIMAHSTAAATGLIDKLEKLNLVERIYSAEDRRKIMVKITQKGIELVTKMRSEISKGL